MAHDTGTDEFKDFNGAEGDRVSIALNANGSGIASYSGVLAASVDGSGFVDVNLGGGNLIRLVGVTSADLQEPWFSFH